MGPGLNAVQDLVEKYGVIFCASAGNDGPGIETVGAPGGIVPGVVSVGAYVTTDMIRAEHSLLSGNAQVNSMLFTWSSRGPQLNGWSGVSVCAPGGAFASVPNWTQRGTQLMSGTSMSSPNCCGCIALILSGLKAQNIDYNPFGVKRALENTALTVDEPIGSGAGLIQVESAFDFLVEYKDNLFQRINFNVEYVKKSQHLKGIYIKNYDEVNETRDYLVTVDTNFYENQTRSFDIPQSLEDDLNLLKSNFSLKSRNKYFT